MIRGTTLRRYAILSELLQKSRVGAKRAAEAASASSSSSLAIVPPLPAPLSGSSSCCDDENEQSQAAAIQQQQQEGPTESPPLPAAPSQKAGGASLECLLRRCVDVVVRSIEGSAAGPLDFAGVPTDMKMWVLRYTLLRRSCSDAVLECLLPSLAVATLSLRGCRRVTDTGLYAVVKHLGPRLRSLDLCNCSGVSAYGLQAVVRHCTELDHLALCGCPAVSDETIPIIFRYHNPAHIRTLDVRHCFLRDVGLTEIASYCPSLRRLDIRCCGLITPAGIDNLTQRVPHLTSFNGGWCVGVDDAALKSLAHGYGGTLSHLDVEMCWRVTSAGVSELARECIALQVLNLHGCSSVDDQALAALAASPSLRGSLREIDISGCDIGDDALESLVASCRELVDVRVANCPRITSYRATRLAQLADVRISL